MERDQVLPPAGRLYVACVVVAGTAAILHSLYVLHTRPVSDAWLILAALTLFSGTFTVRVPSIPATISVSETFVFTAVLLFGTAPATIIVALDGLIISFWRKKRSLHRILFNGAEPAISIWVASSLFFFFSQMKPLTVRPEQPAHIAGLVIPLFLLTIVYFLLNSWLTAVAVSFETHTPAAQVWRRHFLWLSLNYFGGASVAILLARNAPGFDPSQPSVVLSALSVILPLLIISYLTFKTAMGRVQDATKHLTEFNSLYLSIIEALATTIDARDQITHGHIRRVQSYAVHLAHELGVSDQSLIKAVEAAALLHDLGKLQVPEHILNKPGKLTAAEFEKIKSHSRAGAEILSPIDFPYPVVPIVRHHHENWDGTGYPDGLRGTQIPIGARILAVVDCYDALTSDRPYRAKLDDEEAIRILMDRRGTMYDPLAVDAFIRVHARTRSVENVPDLVALEFGHVVSVPHVPHAFSERAAVSAEIQTSSGNVTTDPISGASLPEVFDVASRVLRKMTPASLCVIFEYRPDSDDLAATHAAGEGEEHIRGLRLQLAQSVSGWVAANHQSITNSDPTLELVGQAAALARTFRSCLSTPLLDDGGMVGTLTLYSTARGAFTNVHLAIAEFVSCQICQAMHTARHREEPDERLRLEQREPAAQKVQTTVAAGLVTRSPQDAALLLIEVDDPSQNSNPVDRERTERMLQHVATLLGSTLRNSDILLRHSSNQLLVLLPKTDAVTAQAIASRIGTKVGATILDISENGPANFYARTGVAGIPEDGRSLGEIIWAARLRLESGRSIPNESADSSIH
jgi:putative nucleotidyltransferase with HDIG domain/diguanylate cyclase (GGDEF)-like protein